MSLPAGRDVLFCMGNFDQYKFELKKNGSSVYLQRAQSLRFLNFEISDSTAYTVRARSIWLWRTKHFLAAIRDRRRRPIGERDR